jgi:hypothetical protein
MNISRDAVERLSVFITISFFLRRRIATVIFSTANSAKKAAFSANLEGAKARPVKFP